VRVSNLPGDLRRLFTFVQPDRSVFRLRQCIPFEGAIDVFECDEGARLSAVIHPPHPYFLWQIGNAAVIRQLVSKPLTDSRIGEQAKCRETTISFKYGTVRSLNDQRLEIDPSRALHGRNQFIHVRVFDKVVKNLVFCSELLVGSSRVLPVKVKARMWRKTLALHRSRHICHLYHRSSRIAFRLEI